MNEQEFLMCEQALRKQQRSYEKSLDDLGEFAKKKTNDAANAGLLIGIAMGLVIGFLIRGQF